MKAKNLAKANIANALHSVADNHVTAVVHDVYDELLEQYQEELNAENKITQSATGFENLQGYFEEGNYISLGEVEIGEVLPTTRTADDNYRSLIAECKGGQILLFDCNQSVSPIYTIGFLNVAGALIQRIGSSEVRSIEVPANAIRIIVNDKYEQTAPGTFLLYNKPAADKYITEIDNGDYVLAATDKDGRILIASEKDGTAYLPKLKVGGGAKFQEINSDRYVYALVDKNNRILCAFKADGSIYVPKGMSDGAQAAIDAEAVTRQEVDEQLEELIFQEVEDRSAIIKMFESAEFLLAITDKDDRLILASEDDGTIFIPKGIRIMDRARIQEVNSPQYIYAIVDVNDRLLFGIKHNGDIVMPNGFVRMMDWETYQSVTHVQDVLYLIEGDDGRIEGLYVNDRIVSTDEAIAYFRNENLLEYRGGMTNLPNIYIDYDEMTLNLEYPSNYDGPMFVIEDDLLFVV